VLNFDVVLLNVQTTRMQDCLLSEILYGSGPVEVTIKATFDEHELVSQVHAIGSLQHLRKSSCSFAKEGLGIARRSTCNTAIELL